MAFITEHYCTRCKAKLSADAVEVDTVTCTCGAEYDLEWDGYETEDGPVDTINWNRIVK